MLPHFRCRPAKLFCTCRASSFSTSCHFLARHFAGRIHAAADPAAVHRTASASDTAKNCRGLLRLHVRAPVIPPSALQWACAQDRRILNCNRGWRSHALLDSSSSGCCTVPLLPRCVQTCWLSSRTQPMNRSELCFFAAIRWAFGTFYLSPTAVSTNFLSSVGSGHCRLGVCARPWSKATLRSWTRLARGS